MIINKWLITGGWTTNAVNLICFPKRIMSWWKGWEDECMALMYMMEGLEIENQVSSSCIRNSNTQNTVVYNHIAMSQTLASGTYQSRRMIYIMDLSWCFKLKTLMKKTLQTTWTVCLIIFNEIRSPLCCVFGDLHQLLLIKNLVMKLRWKLNQRHWF